MFTQRPKPWDSYRKVATQTATPGFLVLMLYDGAIAFLERALAGFDGPDPAQVNQAVNNNILRAQAIICELNATLNMEAGGEIAVNFRRLYQLFSLPPPRGQLQETTGAGPGNPRPPARPARQLGRNDPPRPCLGNREPDRRSRPRPSA